jgi:hypothetical protein
MCSGRGRVVGFQRLTVDRQSTVPNVRSRERHEDSDESNTTTLHSLALQTVPQANQPALLPLRLRSLRSGAYD